MRSDEGDLPRPRIGGQAIIEGVMMRGPECVVAAVRLASGEITCQTWRSMAWHKRGKVLGWPIIRGAVSLAEALVLGIRTLNWSADMALASERDRKEMPTRRWNGVGTFAALFLAFVLAVVFFMLVPYELASILKTDQNQPLFHLVAGTARIALFLAYVWIISRFKDIRRVFQYHGAEHQSIFTYESGEELTPKNARAKSCFHPRCGTSYLLIVALLTMAIFVLFDTGIVAFYGAYPNVFVRLLVHLPLLPLVAGLSYELLRLSEKASANPIIRLAVAPGLALQRLTTNPPDDSQREVALAALIAALPDAVSLQAVSPELNAEPMVDHRSA